MTKRAYVAGTFDTKAEELRYVQTLLQQAGVPAVTVDLGTQSNEKNVDYTAAQVAACNPECAAALASKDRGKAVDAMSEAFARFIAGQKDVGGVIGLGGSGNTTVVTAGLRALPIGIPKVMVSTVASANVAPYVGASDIAMIYAVTDVAGLNRISRVVLGNAAHALAGMIKQAVPQVSSDKAALGLTMFGVTTPCVTAIKNAFDAAYDCLVFHATGTGGKSMEKLIESGLIAGALDITTTEVADYIVGGIFPCGPERFDCIARTKIPYVASTGALDMVNFGAMDTVPEKFRKRNLYIHNGQVTLMRTTRDENAAFGKWIGEKMNRCEGPVRFLLPEKGLSAIDAPEKPFHDPEADAALYETLEKTIQQSRQRVVVRVPLHINDPKFAAEAVRHFQEIAN